MRLVNSEILLNKEDIMNIPEERMPCPVLSDNLRSLFSWGIKVHEKGCYNHFMWLIKPGVFASQGMTFAEDPCENYFEKYRLKIWHNPTWTKDDRRLISESIKCALALPWYKRIYDPLQIVGLAIHCSWLQIPGINICSDTASCISLVDKNYNLNHPDPEEVNHWLGQTKGWEVFGRYVPD